MSNVFKKKSLEDFNLNELSSDSAMIFVDTNCNFNIVDGETKEIKSIKQQVQEIQVSGNQNVVLDASKYNKFNFNGEGNVSITLDDWDTGDEAEIIIDTGLIGFDTTQDWIMCDGDISLLKKYYVLQVAQYDEKIFCKVKFSTDTSYVPPITITATTPITFEVEINSYKSITLDAVASDGSNISYTIYSGTLPTGISLTNGVISGTPIEIGTSSAIILATSGETSFPITINFNIKEEGTIEGSGNIYGVIYDPSNSSPACKKIEVQNGLVTEVSDFSSLPAHNFKRCVMSDLSTRTINYYLDPEDSNLKEDGTASVLTGEDGDVMVEIPITYWKVETLSDGRIQYLISDEEFDGSEIHPFFYVSPDGNTVRKQYVGAYQASLCDASGNPLDTEENSENYSTYSTGYKARSIAGTKPFVGMTRATLLEACKNNGGSSQNSLFKQFLFLMMIVEGGSFNTQETISYGFTYSNNWSVANSRLSGRANFGNGTGSIYPDSSRDSGISWMSSDTEAQKVIQFTYRGIENPFGQVLEFEDGIVKTSSGYYMTKSTDEYSDSNYSSTYDFISHSWPDSGGYVKTWDPKTFFVTSYGGSSSTYMCDYSYTSSSSSGVFFRGGFSNYYDFAGAGYVHAYYDLSHSGTDIGGRLSV